MLLAMKPGPPATGCQEVPATLSVLVLKIKCNNISPDYCGAQMLLKGKRQGVICKHNTTLINKEVMWNVAE